MNSLEEHFIEDKGDESDTSLLGIRNKPKDPQRNRAKPYITLLTIGLSVIVGGLAASIVWVLFWPLHLRSCPNPFSEPADEEIIVSHLLHCGSSPKEARSLGCKLQTWSYSWVPEPCFDPQLNEDFIEIHKKNNLPYFTDRNGTEVVDFDTVYEGNIEVLYTVWGSHYWHCAFLMRKYFRQQVALREEMLMEGHLEHCQMWLADPFHFDWMRISTKAPLGFGTCDASGFLSIGEVFQDIDGLRRV